MFRSGKSVGMSLVRFFTVVVMMEEFVCGKVRFDKRINPCQMKEFLGTVNGPWKCESNVSLQPEALEKAKADASQSSDGVTKKKRNCFFPRY